MPPGTMTHGELAVQGMVESGIPREQAVTGLDMIVQQQSVMLATLDMFAVLAVVFAFAALLIWMAPRPQGAD